MVSCMENHSFFESSAAGRSRKMGMAPTPIPRTVHKSSTPPARTFPQRMAVAQPMAGGRSCSARMARVSRPRGIPTARIRAKDLRSPRMAR